MPTKKTKRWRSASTGGDDPHDAQARGGDQRPATHPALAETVEADQAEIEAALARTQERRAPSVARRVGLPPVDHRRFSAELDEMLEELELSGARALAPPITELAPAVSDEARAAGDRVAPAAARSSGAPAEDELLPYHEEEITGPLPPFDAFDDEDEER